MVRDSGWRTEVIQDRLQVGFGIYFLNTSGFTAMESVTEDGNRHGMLV
jgi:hypothetical protein